MTANELTTKYHQLRKALVELGEASCNGGTFLVPHTVIWKLGVLEFHYRRFRASGLDNLEALEDLKDTIEAIDELVGSAKGGHL